MANTDLRSTDVLTFLMRRVVLTLLVVAAAREPRDPTLARLATRYHVGLTMPFGMGIGELVMVAIIVLVAVFGATRLPGAQASLVRPSRGDQERVRILFERRGPWTRWDWAAVILGLLLTAATVVVLWS